MEPRFAFLFALAVLAQMGLFAHFGRFVEPRSRAIGQAGFYLLITWILATSLGWWSLIWILGQPALSVLAHATWCRNHGIDWRTCEPRDEYLRKMPWGREEVVAGK